MIEIIQMNVNYFGDDVPDGKVFVCGISSFVQRSIIIIRCDAWSVGIRRQSTYSHIIQSYWKIKNESSQYLMVIGMIISPDLRPNDVPPWNM